MVTIPTLVKAFNIHLEALRLTQVFTPFKAFDVEGLLTAYRGGTDQIGIKRHGLWSSVAFWLYVTSRCVAASPVAVSLAAAMD